jgi:hypothetical protein
MTINLVFLHEICKDNNVLKNHLQQWNLIPKEGEYKCEVCGGNLSLDIKNQR